MSDIHWTNDKIKLGDLKPWEHNPRQSTEKQAERIADSHRMFGQVETIAIGPEGEVYNGHQRLSSWLAEYGPDYEVEVRRCNRELKMEERQALTAMLHAGATGQWDWDALSGWDTDILQGFGFDEDLVTEWHRDAFALSEQLAAENIVNDPQGEWQGMPEFKQEDETSFRTIHVHFNSEDEVGQFAKLLGRQFSEKTKFIYFDANYNPAKKGYRYTNES